MLQLKNITKIYRSKAGETKALDDLSVEFGETGMIFILGKSGSGKSTLLNVCGGLDNPDSGEIVIKGRSSKDFFMQIPPRYSLIIPYQPTVLKPTTLSKALRNPPMPEKASNTRII